MSKSLSFLTSFLLCVLILQLSSVARSRSVKGFSTGFESTTIVVPDDYKTVQEAIDAANPGDTIYVCNETYYENIFINKNVSLVGEDPEITIIDGSKSNVTKSRRNLVRNRFA